MKILMQIRSNAYTLSGGDTIQMLKTKEYLEKRGHRVDISLELEPDLSDYDVIHLFNITRVQETFFQIQNAKKQNKPVVLSTIYWPNTEFEKNNGGLGMRGFLGKILSIDQMESVKAFAKFVLLGNKDRGTRYLISHSYQDMQKYILKNADVYLPNAMEEMVQIEKHLEIAVGTDDIVVVPNAVDMAAINEALNNKEDKYSRYKDYLICVGRIDPRKNQLSLLEAIKETDYKLLLVGKCSNGQKKYYRKVMRTIEKMDNVEHIEFVDNSELYQIYKQCRVSVLPSWYETPGLVSLEAAAMGCSIVVSPKGTTHDYFGEYAFYCDVMNPESIKEMIEKAYRTGNNEELNERIVNLFTWERAALETEKGYEKAIRKHKER